MATVSDPARPAHPASVAGQTGIPSPIPLADSLDRYVETFRSLNEPLANFVAAQLARCADIARFVGATTPAEYDDRFEVIESEVREQWYNVGYADGLEAGRRCTPYSQADPLEAARMFGEDSPEPDYDAMAAQREWEDLYEKGLLSPVEFGRCLNCSAPCDDLTFQGLCDRCDDLATDATTAGQNGRAGLGYQVF